MRTCGAFHADFIRVVAAGHCSVLSQKRVGREKTSSLRKMGIPQESNAKVTEDLGHGLFQHTLHIPPLSASDGYVFISLKELVERQ